VLNGRIKNVTQQPSANLVKHLDALGSLPPGVVNLRYTVENDWSGDPAIFFWITLSDEAAHPATLSQTARRIRSFDHATPRPGRSMGPHSVLQFPEPIRTGEAQGRGFRLTDGIPRRPD
jgi:hypothetical protein